MKRQAASHDGWQSPACWRLVPIAGLTYVAQLFPTEPDDQVGLDTPAAQSGYASFVIGNEGEVNKMIAKKETGKNGKECSILT